MVDDNSSEIGKYSELIQQELSRISKCDQEFKDELIARLFNRAIKNPLKFSSGSILLQFFVEDVIAKRDLDPRLISFAAISFDLILGGVEPKNALGLVGRKSGNPNRQRKPDVLKWDILEEEPTSILGFRNDNNSRIRKLVEMTVDHFGGGKTKAMEAVAEEAGYSLRQVKNICKGI
jgi:hypothetical protein